MPTYDYTCNDCEEEFEMILRVAEMDDVQECPECGSTDTKRMFMVGNFVLKGDGWSGKNMRIKKQMEKKNRRLRMKEEEMKRDAPGMKLAPNVDGERVDTWAEAKDMAISKGKDTAGYERMERKEKGLADKPTLAS